jgi:hypothetical protein
VKQEISPKVLFAVLAAGLVVLLGVAFWVWRAPSARAVNESPVKAGDAYTSPAEPQSRHERAQEMAREFRASHMRGRGGAGGE